MMENTEIIKALRWCGNFEDREGCDANCPYIDDLYCPQRIMLDAADALEAAEKRIAELESNNPIVESVQVDKLSQRIDELENDKTNLEAEIINLEIALDKAHCELVRREDENRDRLSHFEGGRTMSEVIVRMEMPTGCANCPMADDDSRFCKAAKEYIPMLCKPSWCPIVGVLPEEHGELIDRDALKEKKVYSHERHEYVVPVAYIDWQDAVISAERKGDGK